MNSRASLSFPNGLLGLLPNAIHPESRTKFYIEPSDVFEMNRDITRQAAKLYGPHFVKRIDGSRS
jgi:hypothetical protein